MATDLKTVITSRNFIYMQWMFVHATFFCGLSSRNQTRSATPSRPQTQSKQELWNLKCIFRSQFADVSVVDPHGTLFVNPSTTEAEIFSEEWSVHLGTPWDPPLWIRENLSTTGGSRQNWIDASSACLCITLTYPLLQKFGYMKRSSRSNFIFKIIAIPHFLKIVKFNCAYFVWIIPRVTIRVPSYQ